MPCRARACRGCLGRGEGRTVAAVRVDLEAARARAARGGIPTSATHRPCAYPQGVSRVEACYRRAGRATPEASLTIRGRRDCADGPPVRASARARGHRRGAHARPERRRHERHRDRARSTRVAVRLALSCAAVMRHRARRRRVMIASDRKTKISASRPVVARRAKKPSVERRTLVSNADRGIGRFDRRNRSEKSLCDEKKRNALRNIYTRRHRRRA